jgi:predicted outer membrane lipoprotein
MSTNQITFHVQGSSPEPYAVTFTKSDELLVSCTCSAGQVGQACKHRLSILSGDISAIVSENRQESQHLAQWLLGTKLAAALAAVDIAEKDLTLAKKRATDAKKALGRVMGM